MGTIDDLRKIIALKDLPDHVITWIYTHATYRVFNDGDLVMRAGDPVDYMWLVFEGKTDFYINMNGNRVRVFSFENDINTGGVGGVLPYSRLKNSPGDNYAVGTVKVFEMHKDQFDELEKISPELIQRLVGYMTERARVFATHKLQYEKVTALGQLAAGIAHELNNPAAAISRISSELNDRLIEHHQLTSDLLSQNINAPEIKKISELIQSKKEYDALAQNMMSRLEKEDALADWLQDKGIKDDREKAEIFNESGLELSELESIYSVNTHAIAFNSKLDWMENALIAQKLIKDLGEASRHISTLVGAIKSHVHMDRTHEKQLTDVHKDIEITLTLLNHKIKSKSIQIQKEYCADMREIPAFIGQLNQVWSNIIDNAIFAMNNNGILKIITRSNDREITVEIIDNGAGIPKEIQSRIFDPFFTTKKIGEGTGIGLNLAMTIVKQHQGEIKLASVPGHTSFKVCLPFIQSDHNSNTNQ